MWSDEDLRTIVRWLARYGFKVEAIDRDEGTATVRLWHPEEHDGSA